MGPLLHCSKQHKEREGQSGAVLGPLERLKDQRMKKRQRGCKPATVTAAIPPAEQPKEVVLQGASFEHVCGAACGSVGPVCC